MFSNLIPSPALLSLAGLSFIHGIVLGESVGMAAEFVLLTLCVKMFMGLGVVRIKGKVGNVSLHLLLFSLSHVGEKLDYRVYSFKLLLAEMFMGILQCTPMDDNLPTGLSLFCSPEHEKNRLASL